MSSEIRTTVLRSVPAGSPWVELYAPITEPLAQVEWLLREMVASSSPIVQEVASHIVGAGGKRLRPALLLLCAGAC